MPSLTLRNIPPPLYRELKSAAMRHRRTLDNEAIACLQASLCSQRADPETLLARIAGLQQSLCLPALTDAWLEQAKQEGRP